MCPYLPFSSAAHYCSIIDAGNFGTQQELETMNKVTGIVVAGAFAIIVIGIVVKLLVFPSISGPTRETTKRGFLEFIEVDAKLTDVLPSEPTGGGDAGEDYALAVQELRTNESVILDATPKIDKGKSEGTESAIASLEKIRAHVASGAKKAKMEYLTKHTPKKLQVSWRQEEINHLHDMFGAVDLLGEYYRLNGRLDDAKALYGDMLVGGWHMVKARSHPYVVMIGQQIQGKAINGLSKSHKAADDTQPMDEYRYALRRYLGALNDFQAEYKEKLKILRKAKPIPGDVWNIAKNDKDRAWKVQAILAMGLVRFTHSDSKANAKHNDALLEEFLKTGDPLEKAAAQAAKNYTEAEFNLAGTTW